MMVKIITFNKPIILDNQIVVYPNKEYEIVSETETNLYFIGDNFELCGLEKFKGMSNELGCQIKEKL